MRLHDRHWPLMALALGLATLGLAVVASVAGWDAVGDALSAVRARWAAVCVAAQLVALAGYTVAYRSVLSAEGGPRLPPSVAAWAVADGFGIHAVAGGFSIDHRVLQCLGAHPREATVRVLGLGALEYALLAPAACICAIVLLVAGATDVHPALLWPWAVAVPVGFAVGLWVAAPRRRARISYVGRLRRGARHSLEGIGLLRILLAHPLRHAGAWGGMALYWAADIATLYGALRLFGSDPGVARVVLAYATGYAVTRRSMPLGGAGVTEVLMALALVWCGLSLAHAVPAVLAYRLANVLVPLLPAIRGRSRVAQLMRQQ